MSYKTKLQYYLDPDWPKEGRLPEAYQKMRKILLYGNTRGTGTPCHAKRLLKVLENSPFMAYATVYLDQDVQFEPTDQADFTETFDLIARRDALLVPEGWLSSAACDQAADFVPYEILLPLRERIYLEENAVEVVALAVLLYCFVAAGTK